MGSGFFSHTIFLWAVESPQKNHSELSGLYIHIPFCKQACHYCDFHFSTNQRRKTEMVAAICREIALRKDYLDGDALQTIYFGGGTPSLLDTPEMEAIFRAILRNFTVDANAEITLEANPDDLSPEKISELAALPVNRLSIGIQSFHEPHLRHMNRAHNAAEAETCVKSAQDAGFANITLDLIYGIPHADHSVWQRDLQKALALQVPHISAYCLTIEPKTVFGKWMEQRKIQPATEDFAAEQAEMLTATLENAGYEQYEICNFARNGNYARHNSGYWLRKKYLGAGPSAHSFNGVSRQHNVAGNAPYVKAIGENSIPKITETLTVAEHINDYLLTSLRTRWGCDLGVLQAEWSHNLLETNRQYIADCLQRQLLVLENGILKLTRTGRLLADEITATLFV